MRVRLRVHMHESRLFEEFANKANGLGIMINDIRVRNGQPSAVDTGHRQLLDHVEGFDFQKERAFDMYISIGYGIFLYSYPEGLWSH